MDIKEIYRISQKTIILLRVCDLIFFSTRGISSKVISVKIKVLKITNTDLGYFCIFSMKLLRIADVFLKLLLLFFFFSNKFSRLWSSGIKLFHGAHQFNCTLDTLYVVWICEISISYNYLNIFPFKNSLLLIRQVLWRLLFFYKK